MHVPTLHHIHTHTRTDTDTDTCSEEFHKLYLISSLFNRKTAQEEGKRSSAASVVLCRNRLARSRHSCSTVARMRSKSTSGHVNLYACACSGRFRCAVTVYIHKSDWLWRLLVLGNASSCRRVSCTGWKERERDWRWSVWWKICACRIYWSWNAMNDWGKHKDEQVRTLITLADTP